MTANHSCSSPVKWYQDGLYFECQQCGRCCSGGPGYVWVTDEDIVAIAAALGENKDRFEAVYVQTVGNRKSLREFADYSCVLLHPENRQCILYEHRPIQCRTWPFWRQNIETPNDWKKTAKRCPGCNHGTFHSIDVIEQQASKMTGG